MKNKWIWSLLAVFTLMLAGCGSGSDSDSATGKTNERRFLSVGTAPTGGTFFVVGNAIASVVESNKGELNWSVNGESTKGTQENIRRMANRELDFAMANAAISYFAVRGGGAWQEPHPVNAVMTLAPNVAMFITTQSSGIKSIADMRGKRVVMGPAGAGFEYFLGPILEAHGLTYDDLTPLYNTQNGAVDLLADGSADAAFLGGGVPTASITQACASQDIYFIPFDEAAKQKLIEEYPFFSPASIKAGVYSDLEEDFQGLNVGSMQLITGEQVDEETVYQFTKLLYENREQVVQQHPAGRAINPNNIVRDTGTPFHAGAMRYYREIGIWPEATSSDEN